MLKMIPEAQGQQTLSLVKGSAVREFVVWYEQKYGTERLANAVRSMPLHLRVYFDVASEGLGLSPSRWYPSEPIHVICDAILEGLSDEQRVVLAHDGARAAVHQALRGVFRFVVEKLTTPERYARHIQKMWLMLHNTGERLVTMQSTTQAVSKTTNWQGHHPFLCELTTETMAACFELMGCQNVRVTRVGCVSLGDAACVSTLRWTLPQAT